MNIFSFMKARRERDEDRAASEALDWLLRLSDEPDAHDECAVWRAASPANEFAWREVTAVWDRAGELGSLERADWREEIEQVTQTASQRRHLQWGLAIAASLVLAIGLGIAAVQPDARYATATGQTRQIALEDGSILTVGAQSAVEVDFSRNARRVTLDGGQAYFEVAHDTARPFTVVAGDAEIRVTGTEFDVRHGEGGVSIAVRKGRVELRHHRIMPRFGADPAEVVLTAGLKSQLAAHTDGFAAPQRNLVPPGEWRSGRFFYRDARLGDIVWDLQRYSDLPVRIDDPAIAGLKVTTSFKTTQTGPFLDNLSAILPVRKQADGETIALVAKPVVE